MKKIFKSFLLILLSLVVTSCSTIKNETPNKQNPTVEKNSYDATKYKHMSIGELGNPRIAVPASSTPSYYDDNVLYYVSKASTVSYLLNDNDVLIDTYVSFSKFETGSWASLSLRVSGADRPFASALEQKGYSFLLYKNGKVEVRKNGTVFKSKTTTKFVVDRKYDIQVGAICEDTVNIRLLLIIDGQVIVNELDNTDALISGGSWFNICADGTVSAKYYSKKKNYIPEYEHYTLSTIGSFPSTSGKDPIPEVDEFNNISFISSAQSVGFYEGLQNFSLEFKMNFSLISSGCNFWMTTRSQKFDRASSVQTGYKYRFASTGAIEISKLGEGGGKLSSGKFSLKENVDYIFEIGVVDIDETKTYIYISINNQVITSAYDETNPFQKRGWINMNCDGKMACTLRSSNTKLIPLKNTIEDKTDNLEVKVFFLNTFLKKDTPYKNISKRNLEAISINGYNILELNSMYYSLVNSEKVRAIDVNVINNVLIININKVIYDSYTNNVVDFTAKEIEITKTKTDSGLKSDRNYFLAQTYLIKI